MHATVSIIAIGALTLAASIDAGSGVTSPAAHYAQADQVSVIKVEGMT